MTTTHEAAGPGRLSVPRAVLTGLIGLPFLYVLCWVAAFLAPDRPHRFVRIFTSEPATSTLALAEGLGMAMVFGALIGGMVAGLYNVLAVVDRD